MTYEYILTCYQKGFYDDTQIDTLVKIGKITSEQGKTIKEIKK